ncbi:hypothetical protein D3C87_1812040 [compost metagenome]
MCGQVLGRDPGRVQFGADLVELQLVLALGRLELKHVLLSPGQGGGHLLRRGLGGGMRARQVVGLDLGLLQGTAGLIQLGRHAAIATDVALGGLKLLYA